MLATSAFLTACGGGDSSDGIKDYPARTISGTAATGAPIANAELIFKCSGETASSIYTYFATTDSNGHYSKRVDAAYPPCVISVEFADNNGINQSLSSYAKELPTDTTANITPLTNAVLSATLGASTSTYTISSSSDTLSKLQTNLIEGKDQTAWETLKRNLIARGLDTSAITGHPVTDFFSADAASLGKGYDKILDNLKLKNLEAPLLYQLAGGMNRFETLAQTNDTEVIDQLTGLVWQRCVVGKVWNGTTCSGTATRIFWTEVPQLIATRPASVVSGAQPWRLPTYNELAALQDGSVGASPYIVDKTWFPATPAYWTWTSSPPKNPGPTLVARVIGFQNKTLGSAVGETTDQLNLRLVR